MRQLPWIVGGTAVAAYLWHRSTKPGTSSSLEYRSPNRPPPSDPSTANPPPLTVSLDGRWVWPVGRWNGRPPVISDGFGSQRPGYANHGGADIMFRRLPGDPFKVGTPNGSRNHVMPDSVPALAASDGVITSAVKGVRGYSVIINHGPAKVSTFYTHLDQLFVQPTGPGQPAQRVLAGQPIGTIGFDPQDPQRIKHLHFEIWRGTPNDRLDPQPLMASWRMSSEPTGTIIAARNAQKRSDLVQVSAHARSWPGTAIRPGR